MPNSEECQACNVIVNITGFKMDVTVVAKTGSDMRSMTKRRLNLFQSVLESVDEEMKGDLSIQP